MKHLDGKIALVTGASRGIGRAIALSLARQGASVIINYRENESAARQTLEDIRALGVTAEICQADVTLQDDVNRLFDFVKDTFGRLDILVNNAGMLLDMPLSFMKYDQWQQVIKTNLDSAFLCSKQAAKMMMKTRTGCIINLSSIAGIQGATSRANYCAAKAGLIGLTKASARELAQFGVRVNAVAPGLVETDMISSLKDKTKQATADRTPLKRNGTPEDVAGVVTFLAGPLADYITGETIIIDGGLSL